MELRRGAERYLEAANSRDADAIAELFVSNGTFEDPVGTPPRVGREAIRAMFQEAAKNLQAMTLTRVSPISVAENCAAYALLASTEMNGECSQIDVVELLTFDDHGLISSARAIWHFDDVRTAPASP